ncbi:hypothetical protein [Aeromicrobium fastidiosum]|uniref:DUF4760 domain-containing protein n=1 Tax=Aeromicrobium fastidiosum TaxID=52699 RepID=A0A641ANB9_9ACTN|nr:hypothetical protein [Aeromicrobium fastidiosum]KAA1378768.1 hypothetical protein ESP62_010585 [Aeromicrobium fastidiosum]MBP2392239.1 hypothetical protein [Aeromicrobium fastidiosum]
MILLHAAAATAEKVSGTSDFRIALVGLGGALVGALIGFLGVWLQTLNNEKRSYRQELRGHYAKFVERLAAWDIVNREHDAAVTQRASVQQFENVEMPEPSLDLEAFRAVVQELSEDERNDRAARLTRVIEATNDVINAKSLLVASNREMSNLANEFVVIAPLRIANVAWALISDDFKEHRSTMMHYLTLSVRIEIVRSKYERFQLKRIVRDMRSEDWFKTVMRTSPAVNAAITNPPESGVANPEEPLAPE